MRKLYLDNIRWITVTIVVLYHVLYIFNGAQTFGVIGPFHDWTCGVSMDHRLYEYANW